jgi:hypothetical protein
VLFILILLMFFVFFLMLLWYPHHWEEEVTIEHQRLATNQPVEFLSRPALPTNQSVEFLSRALKLSLWATKQNDQIGFYIAWYDPSPPAPASRELKKTYGLPIAPHV